MFEFNGRQYFVPGSYGILEVIGTTGASIPDFQVGVIIARSIKGRPYNIAGKTSSQFITAYNDDASILRDFGDDNIYLAYLYAARHGAETVFVLNASPNTQSWFYLKDPIGGNSIMLKTKDHWYGITGNDISRTVTETASSQQVSLAGVMSGNVTAAAATTLSNAAGGWTASALISKWVKITGGTGTGQIRKITANTATQLTVSAWTIVPDTTSMYQVVEALWTLTLLPPKNVKRLVDNSGTSDFIYVNSIRGLSAGTDVYLQSNGYAMPVLKTIKSIDTVRNTTKGGYRIIFTSSISSTASMADYARIYQEDNTRAENIQWTGDFTVIKAADAINASSHLIDAVAVDGAAILPDSAVKALTQNVPAGGAGIGIMSEAVTSATSTTLSDTLAGWTAGALTGKYVRIISGTGINQIQKILSNTATQLTVGGWGTVPDNTSTYLIIDSPGTNPFDPSLPRQECSSLADYTNIASGWKSWMKDFVNVNKVKIRVIYFDSFESTTHSVMRDLSITMRSAGSPVHVIGGCGWGDIDDTASGNTNPAVRARALNMDDFSIYAGGAEMFPASLSFAPSIFGDKIANGTSHNLTRDLLLFSSVEANWSDTQVEYFTKSGVCIYDKFPSGFRLVRGINTYQFQSDIWNIQDNKTFLQMPRDLADKFFRGLIEGLDEDLVGGDKITRTKVETYCVKTGNNFKAAGEIIDFAVLSIDRGKAGWLPKVQIEVEDPTDFFGTKVFVIVPSTEI